MFIAHNYERFYKVKQGDVVFDLGAYNGRHTILFSRAVGPGGLIVAVEPEFKNYCKLLSAIKEYRLENVVPINAGIVAKRGVSKIYLSDTFNGAAHSFGGSGDSQMVTGLSLDAIFDNLQIDHIDFLKADIEGAEVELIKSEEALLNTENVAIATYHHPDNACIVEKALLRCGMTIMSDLGHGEYQTEVLTYGWRE